MDKSKPSDIIKVRGEKFKQLSDLLVIEEPLEIRLGFEEKGGLVQKSISVTMRTPGNDEELALGFLFTEGILHDEAQIKNISRPPVRRKHARENVITIELEKGVQFDFKKLERHFYTTSSCGVCGKASIDAVEVKGRFELSEFSMNVPADLFHGLPEKLIDHQSVFENTGGLHATALFDAKGSLLEVREDIGRHNALDKLIGCSFQKSELPLSNKIILVSGRAGFELVQKSIVAGVPILAAVGAPSSLAVELAEDAGMTLVGFLRNGQFNIYSHPERVRY